MTAERPASAARSGAAPLVLAKLIAPRGPASCRARTSWRALTPRESAVTILSAPAGLGKTTLLSQWLASVEHGLRSAWLSLDAEDSDPARAGDVPLALSAER